MRFVEVRTADAKWADQIRRGWADIIEAVTNWRSWYFMGIAEVRQRYRRSVLGPIWVSLTMAIQVFVMGYLLALLFNQDVNRFLPFVCISLILWNYFSSSLNEGALSFISMSGIILQVRRPLCTYVILILWRNTIVFMHNIPVFIIVALMFGIYPGYNYLLIPLGLGLLILNVAWMSCLAGVISARFHDMPQIILNSMTVLVWLTPIYYDQNQLSPKARMLVNLNPLTSIIEVSRAPFLNQTPTFSLWVIAGSVAIVGWIFTLVVFSRFRSRLTFWL